MKLQFHFPLRFVHKWRHAILDNFLMTTSPSMSRLLNWGWHYVVTKSLTPSPMAVTSLMDDPLDPFEAIIVFYFLTRSCDPLLSSDNTVWVAFTSFVVLNGLPQLYIILFCGSTTTKVYWVHKSVTKCHSLEWNPSSDTWHSSNSKFLKFIV